MPKEYTPKKLMKNERGRRIAIGDIHGCFFTFESLLKDQLQITKEDQLFLLGDVIDKGLHSSLVLDLIIDLKRNDFQIFPIKGNHEKKLGGALNEYLELIYHFEYCIELDDFVLSHAGINKGSINPFTDLRGMFSRVNFKFEEEKLISKIQIHGHLVRTINEIENSVLNKERRFSIDSGCYLDKEEFGYLTALDLDEMKIYHQKKKEGDRKSTISS